MSAGAGRLCLFRVDQRLLWWNVRCLHIVDAQVEGLFLAAAKVGVEGAHGKSVLVSKWVRDSALGENKSLEYRVYIAGQSLLC